MPKPVPRAKSRSSPRSPAVKDGEKRVLFTVTVPGDLLRRFDELALRENRSRAGMIMTLMQRAVEE
jgi:hypothetical protein